MRWQDLRRSGNVEDRRGRGGPVAIGGGVGALVIALVVWALGGDPSAVLQGGTSGDGPSTVSEPGAVGGDEGAQFVSAVLGDTEDVWNGLFRRSGGSYVEPRLVLFTDAVSSACGNAQAAMGPFYCPGDQRLYIDLGFYRVLKERLGAPGDFAQAYVIAHEVGHHVQNLTGVLGRVQQAKQAARSEAEANALQVRVELQADCYAGVWAHHAQTRKGLLEPGDMEEALQAASAIGDDTLQRRSQGRVVPDSFTHGSSAQRVEWFRRGSQGGDVAGCDTFSGRAVGSVDQGAAGGSFADRGP